MKKIKIITIAFYLISIILFIAFLIQINNENAIGHNQKAIVVAKDKVSTNNGNTYVFACHPLNSEKLKDFDFHPTFCLYNEVEVGGTIIVKDVPMDAYRNQSFPSCFYLMFTIISALIAFGFHSYIISFKFFP